MMNSTDNPSRNAINLTEADHDNSMQMNGSIVSDDKSFFAGMDTSYDIFTVNKPDVATAKMSMFKGPSHFANHAS